MKKIFFTFLFLFAMFSTVEAMICKTNSEELSFQLYWDDTSIGHNGPTKNPPEIPVVFLDGHTLYFTGAHSDYTVQLFDADGLVYQACLSSLSSQIVLPSIFSGNYELRLVATDYFLSTIIEL